MISFGAPTTTRLLSVSSGLSKSMVTNGSFGIYSEEGSCKEETLSAPVLVINGSSGIYSEGGSCKEEVLSALAFN